MSEREESGKALPEVRLEPVSERHRPTFLEAVARSQELHSRWVNPPSTENEYDEWCERLHLTRSRAFLIIDPEEYQPAGMIAMNEIVRSTFQSAYLGYYALEPYSGRGFMTAGLNAAVAHAFTDLQLHRLEANIQPDNHASKALVKRIGFRYEGYSPKYLKINGVWQDHERWALLGEEYVPIATGTDEIART